MWQLLGLGQCRFDDVPVRSINWDQYDIDSDDDDGDDDDDDDDDRQHFPAE